MGGAEIKTMLQWIVYSKDVNNQAKQTTSSISRSNADSYTVNETPNNSEDNQSIESGTKSGKGLNGRQNAAKKTENEKNQNNVDRYMSNSEEVTNFLRWDWRWMQEKQQNQEENDGFSPHFHGLWSENWISGDD